MKRCKVTRLSCDSLSCFPRAREYRTTSSSLTSIIPSHSFLLVDGATPARTCDLSEAFVCCTLCHTLSSRGAEVVNLNNVIFYIALSPLSIISLLCCTPHLLIFFRLQERSSRPAVPIHEGREAVERQYSLRIGHRTT